jgi:hypothetical protein
MDKKEVLANLDDSIVIEELAVPIYRKHFDSALFWSGLKEEDVKIIKTKLNTLIDESLEHVEILKKLKEIVKKGGSDV